LNLQELSSDEQVRAIESKSIDVGFARPPIKATEALQMQVIWEEPLILALPESSPLAAMPEISISTLADQPFIQLPRHVAPNFYAFLMKTYVQAGFVPNIVQEAQNSFTIVNLVAGGIGISLLPASIQGLQRTGVVYKPLCQPSPTISMAVIWHRDNMSPSLDVFLKIVWRFAGIRSF
jgi:DNA-binding transcriptional LysR family regulator